VETRIKAESVALVRLAETGSVGTVAETNADFRAASPVRHGSSTERTIDVQEKLRSIGMLAADGRPLVADGDFGPSTQAAVKSFQSSVGLPQTGEVGALTLRRLDEQAAGRQQLVENRSADQVPPVCRLDDSSHPDNAFFQNVRQHVHNLDQSLGRVPDQYSDNLASALTVQARSDGMQRVDQIALSDDGNALWAVQTPPGRRDHLFDLSTNVPTAESCTPMEQSAARWPEAMQQFQGHEQQRAESQQRVQDRIQTESQSNNVSGPSMGL
jgi:peptidoglycan hydrolase-like protein with peptidoglycan-binding domain